MMPERGQASVEFLAFLPVLLVLAALATQILAVGYASVVAGNAAEAAALAVAGGGDPEAAARAALPGWGRSRARLTVTGGEVHLRLRPPSLLRPLARRLEVHAEAEVEAP
jgi:Flp pilus assembly protein TadG